MKTVKLMTCLTVIAIFGFITSCKKDPGYGGKAHIHGHVEHEASGKRVGGAIVSIWFDASSASGTADDNTTTKGMVCMTMSSDDGEFEFENLKKGDYYVQCMITDTCLAGTPASPVMLMDGEAITIKKKKEEVEADIHL